jgi:hypothetical protein
LLGTKYYVVVVVVVVFGLANLIPCPNRIYTIR